METYKLKVLNYIEEEKRKVLQYIHFSFTDKIYGANEESVYEEIWRAINSPTVEDKEVLGKYSI